MNSKNKYVKNSHISEAKFREIIKYFSEDLNATQISNLTNISRPTINKYLKAIRIRISEYCHINFSLFNEKEVYGDNVENQSVKGQRKKSISRNAILFGLFKREGKIHTEIVPDTKQALMRALIRGKVGIDSITHSDGWRDYHGLVDIKNNKFFRIPQGEHSQINDIESFWSYAKIRLSKFRGINKENFNLYLKESEYRFNHRGEDLYKLLLKIFRKNPIMLS